jgi:starvation-inducible outer membrane lipoprotein
MRLLAVSLCFLLAGCEAVIPNTMANLRMSESQKAYRACVLAHSTDAAEQCKAQREIYEADLQAARVTRPRP